jgi:uncharacterized membrane protein
MQQLFMAAAQIVALLIEASAAVVIVLGSVQTLYSIFRSLFQRSDLLPGLKAIWRQYATWLLLGLEFALAADVIRTAVAPTWNDIAQLAAIAAIRTFLNYFLQRDIQTAGPLAN